MKNKLKELIARKIAFAGLTLNLGSTRAAEILARSGVDFLMVDLQHGNFDKNTATDSIRAIGVTGTIPLGRVADNFPGAINDVLDAGALGVVVPMVNCAGDARKAVSAAFYSPLGQRSKGGSAPIVYGDDYAVWANAEIILIVMIETAMAVEKAAEIFAVPGITACLVGTSDLALDMKCGRDSDEIRAALAKVMAAGKQHDVAVGTAVGSINEIEKLKSLAPAFYLISHDQGLLKEAGKTIAGRLMDAMGRN
ncbi:HpcH/HpaI aldolase family protein [Sodalis sp. RH21]|uniref:HpcH/HpaI aldolase family protein n=1 Tax=unclassified Sodalis (in: enterobacteria) TaxID=2636512 RepID=UPI0039B6AFCA